MAGTRPEPDELPTPNLVRRQTDRLVMDALLAEGAATRPDLARATGVSKPTVSESVRRLEALGLAVEAGKRSGGRGRSGVRYELSPGLGIALAIHLGPGGAIAQATDAAGAWTEPALAPLGLTASAAEASAALADAADRATVGASGPVRARVASVANPVDPVGYAPLLPGSPFLTEPLDVASALGPGTIVGNDVNWAALAEAASTPAEGSFLYCYLGAGIGGAIVEDSQVRVGSTGLAGELAYVATRAADGGTVRLLDAVLGLGLGAAGSTIDVEAARRLLAAGGPEASALITALGVALGSAANLLGVSLIVLGGPWADASGLVDGVRGAASAFSPRPVNARAAAVRQDAPLAGARLAARASLVDWVHAAVDAAGNSGREETPGTEAT